VNTDQALDLLRVMPGPSQGGILDFEFQSAPGIAAGGCVLLGRSWRFHPVRRR
jgi:hypothetical protein